MAGQREAVGVRHDGQSHRIVDQQGKVIIESLSEDGRLAVQTNGAGGGAGAGLHLGDGVALGLGNAAGRGPAPDAGLFWSLADSTPVASNALVLFLADANQVLHISDYSDRATDWNLSANAADPEVIIHSTTTPATDYLLLGAHSGSQASIAVAGGTLDITAVGEVVVNEAQANVDFRVESDDSASAFIVDAGTGTVFIGETVNAQMDEGLTIKQPAVDKSMFTLKSADVATGLTTAFPSANADGTVETDDIMTIMKLNEDQGGVGFQVMSEGSGGSNQTLYFDCIGGTPQTADEEANSGVIGLYVGEHSQDNSLDDMAAASNIVSMGEIHTDSTRLTRLILKANGVLHLTNTTLVALDNEDDVQLVRAMQREGSDGTGLIASQYDNPFYSYSKLQELGLAGKKSDNGTFMFPLQARMHAYEGAMWQTYVRVRDLEEKLAITERKLVALEA